MYFNSLIEIAIDYKPDEYNLYIYCTNQCNFFNIYRWKQLFILVSVMTAFGLLFILGEKSKTVVPVVSKVLENIRV